MGINNFKKSERLCSKKIIKELFNEGSYFYLYPFKTIYLPASSDLSTNQILVSVPKRSFKRAVDRNVIKRKIKEAYRLNKSIIPEDQNLAIAFIYTAKEILDYHSIEKKLKSILLRLHKDNISSNEK